MVWKSAYDVRASMATMEALVKKGWAESKGHGSLGSMYSPRTTVMYRAIRPTKHAPDVVDSSRHHAGKRAADSLWAGGF